MIAVILLEFGASTVLKDSSGHSPIQLASKHFHITTFRILLEANEYTIGINGTSLSRVEMHILEASSPTVDLDLSSRENETKTEMNTEGKKSISISNRFLVNDVLASSADCELRLDLDQEHDYFFQTRSALQYAIEKGDPIIAQTLMDAKVDLNNYEENGDGPRHRLPLELKVPKGLIRITELLVKHVDHGRGRGGTPSNSSATTLVNDNAEWRVALFLVTFLAT